MTEWLEQNNKSSSYCSSVEGCRTGDRISAAASHALDERRVRNIQQNDLVGVDVGLLQSFRLLSRSGKAVQKPTAVDALWRCERLLPEVDDQGIRNKLAGIHVSLGFLAEGRAGFDCSAQQISGTKMRSLEFFNDLLALGALARSGGAGYNQAANLCSGKRAR